MRISEFLGWMTVAMLSLPAMATAAEPQIGRPVDGAMSLQPAASPVMQDIHWLDDFILWIIGGIVLFVMILLAIIIFRFNHRANPTPAKFTHNAVLEVVWTAIPVLILVVIAIPSLRLLFLELDVPHPDLTIKVTGNQWYWSYQYPDQKISFDAFMIGQGAPGLTDKVKAELKKDGYTTSDYLLATDNKVVVPVNKIVHVLVTGADVIHSWTVPAFGSKIDAIPGRINETWFKALKTGLFFGQCSELCGKDHAFMPIVVKVVTQKQFDDWVKTKQAMNDTSGTKVATAK